METWGIRVGTRGIKVEMWGMGVGTQGISLGLWGLEVTGNEDFLQANYYLFIYLFIYFIYLFIHLFIVDKQTIQCIQLK